MNKWFIFILTGIAVFSIQPRGYALDQPPIKAEVDRSCVGPGEYLTYKLTFNSPGSNEPLLKPPAFKDFNVLSAARSANMEVKGNKITASEVYVYVLLPRENGKLKLGPAKLTVKGVEYSTASFDIDVNGKCSQGPAQNSPPAGKEIPPIPDAVLDPEQPQYIL